MCVVQPKHDVHERKSVLQDQTERIYMVNVLDVKFPTLELFIIDASKLLRIVIGVNVNLAAPLQCRSGTSRACARSSLDNNSDRRSIELCGNEARGSRLT